MSRWQEVRGADQGQRLDLNMLRFAEMPMVCRRATNDVQRKHHAALPVAVADCSAVPVAAPVSAPKSRRAMSAQALALSKERKSAKLMAQHRERMKKEVNDIFKNGPISAAMLSEMTGLCKNAANFKLRDWKNRGLVRFLELRPVPVKSCKTGTFIVRDVMFFEEVK